MLTAFHYKNKRLTVKRLGRPKYHLGLRSYGSGWKQKLVQNYTHLMNYNKFVFFAEVEVRSNVLCFKNMVKYTINELSV